MSLFFEVRPATDADAVPLSEFLNACTLAHQGISRSSPAGIVARLHLEGADPWLDSFLALADGGIVGFGHLWPGGSDEVKFFARTHPEARGRGIGSRLLSLCDGRAAALLPGARRTTTTWAGDTSAPGLLEGHGYRPIRYFVTMQILADVVSEEPPSWPAGVERVRLSERPDLSGALYAAWRKPSSGMEEGGRERGSVLAERREDKRGSAFPFEPSCGCSRSTAKRWSASVSASSTRRRRVGGPRRRDRRRPGAAGGRARVGPPARMASGSCVGEERRGSCWTLMPRTRRAHYISTSGPG